LATGGIWFAHSVIEIGDLCGVGELVGLIQAVKKSHRVDGVGIRTSAQQGEADSPDRVGAR
jgi:hypothetical protein